MKKYGAARKSSVMRFSGIMGLVMIISGLLLSISWQSAAAATYLAAAASDWPTYLANNARTGFNGSETALNTGNVSKLKIHWQTQVTGGISVQPVVVGGMIYWGAWDGNEYATDLNHKTHWKTFVGQTHARQNCKRSVTGVASAATVASALIKGVQTQVDFVGGGNARFYALSAADGRIIWSTQVGVSPNEMILDATAVYGGSVYIGLSSYGEYCAATTVGKLVQLNASTGAILHTFNVVPAGCVGGGIWGSPTIDEANHAIYVATGNATCMNTSKAFSLVKLSTTDLSVISSWQLKGATVARSDNDFGSTPTLFTATVKGALHSMVGLVNKNRLYYAFDRNNLAAGPLWTQRMASGQNSISPSSWDGKNLYVADGSVAIGGKECAGNVSALNPATGAFIWRYCAPGAVSGAVTSTPGLVFVGADRSLVVVDSRTGKQLFAFTDTHAGSHFWGAATISGGVVYAGNLDGVFYAFGL